MHLPGSHRTSRDHQLTVEHSCSEKLLESLLELPHFIEVLVVCHRNSVLVFDHLDDSEGIDIGVSELLL